MSAGPARQAFLMCNIAELGVFLYFFFFFNFYFLCANLSHLRHRLGAVPRPWPSEIGQSLSPTISLEGTQAALLIQGSTVGHSQGMGGSDSIIANYRKMRGVFLID